MGSFAVKLAAVVGLIVGGTGMVALLIHSLASPTVPVNLGMAMAGDVREVISYVGVGLTLVGMVLVAGAYAIFRRLF
jgi:hypothetical protein